MVRVLFVCLGNICRSPMAEAILRDLVRKENLSDKIEVDSAGIGSWHIGDSPHRGTKEVLERRNISYRGMVARQIADRDWDQFDYIIAMDDQNIRDLRQFQKDTNRKVFAKLMDFVKDPLESNVPDPYYTGNFDYTFQLVSEGCKQLLEHIKNDLHNKGEI